MFYGVLCAIPTYAYIYLYITRALRVYCDCVKTHHNHKLNTAQLSDIFARSGAKAAPFSPLSLWRACCQSRRGSSARMNRTIARRDRRQQQQQPQRTQVQNNSCTYARAHSDAIVCCLFADLYIACLWCCCIGG